MDATNDQTRSDQVPYPNLPPLIDSRAEEYRGPGITSAIAIFGHPIHPVLVTFPIAFLSGVAGTDLGYWLTQDFFWARAGLWLLGAGVLAGVAAGITGMIDFVKIPRVRKRRAGWAHMALNIGALGLSTVNLGLRLGNPAGAIIPVGLILSCTVAVLLMLSGWFGGELTFRHKVGIVGPGDALDL